MLDRFADPELLTRLLLPREQWRPYPPAADTTAWRALPEAQRRGCVAAAETALTSPWPELPATLYLQFARNGNRRNYEIPYFARRCQLLALAIGECVEGAGRFLDPLADAIWQVCEESTWCLPAHTGMQKAGSGLPDPAEPVLDLFAAETGALLAWVHYLLETELRGVSPHLPQRIRHDIAQRVLAPTRDREDWWWQGFRGQTVNNWNPWINSNVLACALLIETDVAARATLVAKTLRSLDCFLTPYPADGGCDEGPAYWGRAGASVFDCLDLLDSASAGAVAAWDQPLIAEMGRFICRVHLADSWFINFADAPARVRPDAALVFNYGERIRDAALTAFGAFLRRDPEQRTYVHIVSAWRLLRELFTWTRLAAAPACAPLHADAWLPVLQVLVARAQAGSCAGLTLAVKGGHNAESHNHNDVGNFLVYAQGRPVLIDVGVETYRRATFSGERYRIWTMQSQFHNLPTVNGIQQAPGRAFAATNVSCRLDAQHAEITLDLAKAYPAEADLTTWVRHVAFKRGGAVTVTDRYACQSPPRELFLSLMTPCEPRLEAGVIELRERDLPAGLRTGAARLRFDADRLAPTVETIPIADEKLRDVWGERLYRLVLRAIAPAAQGEFALTVTAAP